MKIKEEFLTKENISGVSILDLVPEERLEFVKEYLKVKFYGTTINEVTKENGTLNLDSFLLYECTEFIEEILDNNKEYVEILQNTNERLELAIPIEKFDVKYTQRYEENEWKAEDVFRDPIKIVLHNKDDIIRIINILYEEFISNDEIFGILLKAIYGDNEFYWNPFHPFFLLLPPEIKKELYDLTIEAVVYPTNIIKEPRGDYIKYLSEITLPVAAKAALAVAEKRYNYKILSDVNLVPSSNSSVVELKPEIILKTYLGFDNDDDRSQNARISDYVFVPVHMMVRNGILAPAYGEVIIEDTGGGGGLKGYNVSPQISSNISEEHSVCTGTKTSIVKNAYVLSTMNVDSPYMIQDFYQIAEIVSSLKRVYKDLKITPET